MFLMVLLGNSFKTSDLLFYLGSIKDDEVIYVPYDVDFVKYLAFLLYS